MEFHHSGIVHGLIKPIPYSSGERRVRFRRPRLPSRCLKGRFSRDLPEAAQWTKSALSRSLAPNVRTIADWHTYQVLTKRSERLCGLLNGKLRFAADRENIWWGVSVEDRKHGLPRVAHLAQASAKVRFLSIEPLLEDLGKIDLSGIDWVIVGGESGPGARPMNKEWVLSIREQCRSYGIPFFFKQWGGVRKAKAGRELDGRTYDEYPQRNPAPMPDKQKRATFAEHFFQSYRQ